MRTMDAVLALGVLFPVMALAEPTYLNLSTPITVDVGPGTTATTSNNTFTRGFGIEKVIDAPSADAEEFHNQDTHIWYSGGALELRFDFGTAYDLTTLHFWNYTGEAYDVDQIDFTLFDGSGVESGQLTVFPALGSPGGIRAEDIPLAAPQNVRYVTALLSGSNGQVDFQNLGFTATLSTDRCGESPNDPICKTPEETVPYPLMAPLFLSTGLITIALGSRRA